MIFVVGGGGGSLTSTDALLIVQAPAGSTVTIAKGSTTKTDQGHENADDSTIYDYYFVIHQSQFDSTTPWTITATDGTNTASETVLITTNKEYEIILSYRVPSEYQEVEYLQSTGTQWIRTNIAATYARIETIINVQEYNADARLFTASSAPIFRFCDFTGNQTRLFFLGNSADNITYGAAVPLNTDSQISATMRQGLQSISVNGSVASKTLTVENAPRGNFQVFVKGEGSTSNILKAKLHALKIYDATSDSLITELIPCYRISDGVAGLWDSGNAEFLTNAGTGTFVVGSDV